MPQQTFQEKKGEEERLRRQLIKVRQGGLDGFAPDQVLDLRAVARRLVAEGSDRERIEASLELAIARFSEVKTAYGTEATTDAARIWFGLDPATRDKDHLERHEAAAGRLGQKVRRFENQYGPEILERLVGRLVWLQNQRPSPDEESPDRTGSRAPTPSRAPEEEEEESKPRHSKRTAVGFIGAACLAAGLILVAVFALLKDESSPHEPSTHSSKTTNPPQGTVIDAATGAIAQHIDKRVNNQGAYLSGGNSFRACNRTTETTCAYSPEKEPSVSAGDVLELGIMLYNPTEAPLPYATLVINRASMTPLTLPRRSSIQANLAINWPGTRGPEIGPIREEVDLPTASPKDGYVSLAYIPGSTVLRDRKHHFLAHLPDGIMEGGIALADLGSPASCFNCGMEYIRFVFFKARVGAIRYRKP